MPGRILAVIALTFSLAIASAPARAAWYEASSEHFIIYAEGDEDEVRLYAENLERFHSAMEDFTQREVSPPSPSNRIKVFAVGSDDKVRNLAGSRGVAGFYLPRAEGSVAFVQGVKNKVGYPDVSTVVLLHEYAHHFLSLTDRYARPLWMNEGAAEFLAKAYFKEDGSVFLGTPALNRSFSIFWKEDEMTSVRELLDMDYEQLSRRNTKDKNSFYGRSWLLYHYLTVNEERQGQLRNYWLEVLKGKSSLEAAQTVLGDFGVLERQLNHHFRNRKVKSHHVPAERIAISPVALRTLSKGEVGTMEIRQRLERGASAADAAAMAKSTRAIAERQSEDGRVWSLLAKAELAAGNNAAAIAAADKALTLNANDTEALLQKGIAGFRLARTVSEPGPREAAYDKAMAAMRKLGTLEPDHTMPLIYTYRAEAERGLTPGEDAKAAFFRAAELAPFDQELWLLTGMIRMNDGQIAEARAALQPIASNPHGGAKSEQVRQLLGFLADKPEGTPIRVQAAISQYFLDE